MQRPPWLGKLIGGAIGWLVLGPVGLMIGLLLGHVADKTHIVPVSYTHLTLPTSDLV